MKKNEKEVIVEKPSNVSTLIVPLLILLAAIVLVIIVNRNVKDEVSVDSNQLENSNVNQSNGSVVDFPSLLKEDTATGDPSAATVELGKKIKVRYYGTLADGSVFDSTNKDSNGAPLASLGGEPISFTLAEGQLIKGWTDGLPGMKVGGKRKLTIPSSLGYGATGSGSTIPPNAGLIFEVEIVGVE